jgi:phenylacetate-CoA ligase
MTVVVEAVGDTGSETVEAAVRQLTLRIKTQTGITAWVEAGPSGSIERSTGKAQRVVDKRSIR